MSRTDRAGGSAPRRWRHYRTATGRDPLAQFLAGLPSEERATVIGAMKAVCNHEARGGARQLNGQLWEVKARGRQGSYRVLFAEDGTRGQVLLALHGFRKQSQKTPLKTIELAKQRLSDWRRRGGPGRPPERDRSAGR